jgi:hypothetical protein
MSMPNEHRNAEHTNRPASFNPNPASVMSFWDAPNTDLDMFTRWIKLSDEVLGANPNVSKKAGNGRRRSRPLAPCCA